MVRALLQRLGDQVVDEAFTGGSVLLEAGEVVGSEPVVGGVLGPLQGGVVQVAVDVDEVVGLATCAAPVVAGPGGDPEQASYAAQLPAGLLFDFPGEGVQQGLAGLDVAADDVPAVGKSRRSGLRRWAKALPSWLRTTAPTAQTSPSAGTGISTPLSTATLRCWSGMASL